MITKNKISKITIVTTILLLTLTYNIFLVQAGGAGSITLNVSDGGAVSVYTINKKGKETFLGEFTDMIETIKMPGNIEKVRLELNPDDAAWHVSVVKQDENYIAFGDPRLVEIPNGYNYELVIVDKQHTIDIEFSAFGTATVPGGVGVSAFLSAGAGLTFANTDGGVATGEIVEFPDGTSIIIWEINYEDFFSGGAQVAIHYDQGELTLEQEQNLRLIRGDSLEALYSDVDGDLDVDGTDVSIIANAVNTNQQPDWYLPLLDINNDDQVDSADVHIVNANKGALLQNIFTSVDTDLNIIYGTTNQFSVFRCR